jgi:hypothetical protein
VNGEVVSEQDLSEDFEDDDESEGDDDDESF